MATVLTLMSSVSTPTGQTIGTPTSVPSQAFSQILCSVTFASLDLVSPATLFVMEVQRLDDDSVWRTDFGFSFQGAVGLSGAQTMQVNGVSGLVGRQIRTQISNNSPSLLGAVIVTATLN